MSLKDELVDRITKLQAKRDDFVAQSRAQAADMDARLTTLKTLLANWDTLTVDQALAGAAQAGLKIRVDA